ncbi:hypothetical protein [Planctomycetes bacterium K23_9]|uniref:Uncharacterized protein n=1 Tax=Stieleria marina TaxID=1930275 RepID=A0A517NR87_9BACT|nr:hypothetical protein K239x_15860 [Planctomycetes bacterium K23_9]
MDEDSVEYDVSYLTAAGSREVSDLKGDILEGRYSVIRSQLAYIAHHVVRSSSLEEVRNCPKQKMAMYWKPWAGSRCSFEPTKSTWARNRA